MKYLIASGLSGLLFLGMHSPTMTANFWQKVLHNKEETKDKKKREYKLNNIIWAIGTIIIFAVAFFGEL